MHEGSMYIEKRKFKRIEKEYAIRYKLMPNDNSVEAMKKDGAGKDISIGGVRIEGDCVGSINDVVRVEFAVAGTDEPVITFAEIKWIRDVAGKTQFGVEFLALKDSDKEALQKLLDE